MLISITYSLLKDFYKDRLKYYQDNIFESEHCGNRECGSKGNARAKIQSYPLPLSSEIRISDRVVVNLL